MIKNQCITDARSYGIIKTILSSDSHAGVKTDAKKIAGAKITVRGFSMSPFIKDRAVVILKRFDRSQGLCVGDVVAANTACGNGVLVHRVIGLKKNQILLKGDNNRHNDGWIPESAIIGIVEKTSTDGLFKTHCRPVNFLIAKGSAAGWFNRLLLPALRATRKRMLKPQS